MYHHLAAGLTKLAASLKVSRFRRLSPNEIDLIEQAGLKFSATLASLETSRQACQLLQTQLDRLKELILAGKFGPEMELLLEELCANQAA